MAIQTETNDILQSVAPQLDAVAKNLLQQVYGEEGLPITSCYLESTVKQMNARVKGAEKFCSPCGGEALLQLRADYLSDNDSMPQFWSRRQRQQTGRRPTKLKT